MAINSLKKYEFVRSVMEYIVHGIHIVMYQKNFIASKKNAFSPTKAKHKVGNPWRLCPGKIMRAGVIDL